eukprot:CAMPEP_0118926194 /NCGR_PEP_ID=MMETSP1169-20130426/3949_1 /TAXON_ID=36882 /ORGANISM="Pyramimonas obovata, Strain CCMP722" /LENGTH=253 /DNA_ID=CAMNT_0006867697 /DNA_START=156 /DNA_END=914 /DNA_ORIENTATION=-
MEDVLRKYSPIGLRVLLILSLVLVPTDAQSQEVPDGLPEQYHEMWTEALTGFTPFDVTTSAQLVNAVDSPSQRVAIRVLNDITLDVPYQGVTSSELVLGGRLLQDLLSVEHRYFYIYGACGASRTEKCTIKVDLPNRVMRIQDSADLFMYNMIIQDGVVHEERNPDFDGGCIWFQDPTDSLSMGSTGFLYKTEVNNCATLGGKGAGIYIGGNVTLVDTAFAANTEYFGERYLADRTSDIFVSFFGKMMCISCN